MQFCFGRNQFGFRLRFVRTRRVDSPKTTVYTARRDIIIWETVINLIVHFVGDNECDTNDRPRRIRKIKNHPKNVFGLFDTART